MANITKFLPKNSFNRLEGKAVIVHNKIDFSKQNAAIADTVDALEIPKGTVVKSVTLVCHTPEAAVTVAVGDQTNATQFLVAQTLTTLGAGGGVISAATAQKFYATANRLRLTIAGAAGTNAVISVTMECYQVATSAL